jgi:hypothetical protein
VGGGACNVKDKSILLGHLRCCCRVNGKYDHAHQELKGETDPQRFAICSRSSLPRSAANCQRPLRRQCWRLLLSELAAAAERVQKGTHRRPTHSSQRAAGCANTPRGGYVCFFVRLFRLFSQRPGPRTAKQSGMSIVQISQYDQLKNTNSPNSRPCRSQQMEQGVKGVHSRKLRPPDDLHGIGAKALRAGGLLQRRGAPVLQGEHPRLRDHGPVVDAIPVVHRADSAPPLRRHGLRA